ncbi:lytic murein transglycosylase [Tabrizicola sp. M-4]|uniref:lytic murein transglycosylase n=1 Tax=Tabrizicola sp. M-4 TaxID=3055847 RepID=UPI003DA7BD70
MRAAILSLSLLPLPALAGPAALPHLATPQQLAPGGGIVIQTGTQSGLDQWVETFRPRALAAGIAPATFDAAFAGLRYNPDVIEKDRNQAEFTRTIWDYLDRAVSDLRVENGRAAIRDNRRLLDRLEATYGVPKEVVVAVWGLESSFGANRGDIPVIEALATLAYEGRRGPFFEAQLIDALRILQSGDAGLDNFTGSWAGAMGHTQFIPSSFLSFAVDFDGDGRRDIWSDDPADALASTAAYLAKSGWQAGVPWGVEVTLPDGIDYMLAGNGKSKPTADWAALGLRDATGGPLPDIGPAELLLPAGAQGAAFLITPNFRAIERYNTADAYVIAIGHLSDRLAGGGLIRAAWPRQDRALTGDERRELQTRLTAAGFDTGGVDGKIGPKTLNAVRAFQRSLGLVPDGYASPDILQRLR